MAVKFLDNTGLGYFWGKIKAWCNSTFAAIAHTHTSYAVKHSYTTAANAAKNWYRIANANTQQLDISKPIRAQFIVTAYNTSYDAGYYETWFVNAIVFGRQAHIIIFGGSSAPFSQARILYENTTANIDANDRPAIDLYLNYVLPNGTTKIEVEEIYNSGWTFLADGQLAASTVPSGFESVASTIRNNGIDRSTTADYASYLNRQISNITAAFTLADSYLYRSRTLNCTGTFTITIPSINSGYMWCVIKNKNATSGVITLHPSTTSVLIDGSNADIKLQPMEYVCIHSAGANNYSLIADGRWKSQKANDVDVVHIAGTETVTGAKTFSSEVKISSVNALRIKSSNYGAFFRNDNSAFYLLVTASGDADGTWTTARPLTVNLSDGKCSINGNAATASAVAWSGITNKPTTISGYGITDAKIANGTITLGSNSITPLTSHQTLPTLSRTISGSGNAITDITVSNHAITATKGSTFALDSDVIHKNSNEAIEGIKEFSNSYHDSTREGETDWESSSILLRLKNYDKGTAPDTAHFGNLVVLDKDGTNQNWNGRLGVFEYSVSPDYGSVTRISAYKNEVINGVDTHENATLGVGYDINGIRYAYAPSTSETRTTGIDILTRDWIPKDTRIVHTTGNETIAGTKTFSSTITGSISGNAVTVTGTAGTSTLAWNSEITLYTIGGHAVKAKLPANPNTNTTYTFATGDSNGQIKVTPSGGSAQNISVKGLGTAAYKADTYFAVDSNVVHTTGNESISGIKVFNNNIAEKRASLGKGEAPSENLYYNFVFVDKNSTTSDIGVAKRFGGLETLVSTNKDTSTYLVAYQNVANGTANVSLGVTTNSTYDFDFRYAFVRNGNFKLFDNYSYICVANSDFIRGTAPSTTLYDAPLKFMDSNGNLFSEIYCVYGTDKLNYVSFLVAKGTDTSNTTEQLGIGFDADGNSYTRCPHPADSSNTWNIATTYWVRRYCEVTKGFLTSHQSLSNYVTLNSAQTISSNKTFSSSIISNVNPIIRRANNTGHTDICGGSDTTSTSGAKIILRGSSETSGTAGEAIIQGGDSSGYRYITVRPDMIYVANNGFAFDKYHSSYILRFAEDYPNNGAYIYAGAQNFDGAGLMLFGRTQDSANGNHGKFYLRASRKSSSSGTEAMRVLTGTPDGSIYWNGQAIQTSSDERLKTAFAPVDDSILDGWDNVNWIQFKYKDAVAEKGTNARYHVGLIAQHVSKQFENLETQIEKYGIVCHEYEKEHYIESTVVDLQAYTDDEGVYHEEKSHVEREFMPGRDEWTVRYTEALCMEAAYQRRKNKILENRISELEKQVSDMIILLQNLTNNNG